MKRSLLLFGFVLTGFLFLVQTSCTYEEVLPEDLIDDVPDDVSFSKDIIPIFNESCNTSGCHNTGGIPPDLTPANAYNALINGNFINTTVPENSELYQWMAGNRKLPMPIEGANVTYNALVLKWIEQGALDN